MFVLIHFQAERNLCACNGFTLGQIESDVDWYTSYELSD